MAVNREKIKIASNGRGYSVWPQVLVAKHRNYADVSAIAFLALGLALWIRWVTVWFCILNSNYKIEITFWRLLSISVEMVAKLLLNFYFHISNRGMRNTHSRYSNPLRLPLWPTFIVKISMGHKSECKRSEDSFLEYLIPYFLISAYFPPHNAIFYVFAILTHF